MKTQKNKTKISATTVTLVLIFAMTFSLIAIPAVIAQDLIMNLPGDDIAPFNVEIHQSIDIDLNGDHAGGNIELWVKYPGRTDFTYINEYPTVEGGDLDVYDFDFNETGNFELKWMLGSASSNVSPAKVWPVGGVPMTIREFHEWCYVSVSPDTIGIGQQVLLVFWSADLPPDIGEQSDQVAGGRAAWYDVGFYVTDPEGNKETIPIAKTDPVGSGWVNYTPDKIGTYTVQSWFPETWKNTTSIGSHYSAAVSVEVTFTVQAELVEQWPESPVTDDYWTRPISGASREWYQLTGNRLGGDANEWPIGSAGGNIANFGYGLAPESAHILWSKPFFIGGIMDERFGNINYQTSHYQGVTWSATIILDGKVHYTPRYTTHGGQGWAVLDLYTGETLFLDYDAIKPSFGQIYNYESPNQHGGFAYLWRTSGVSLPDRVRIAHAELIDGEVVRTSASTTVDSSDIRTGTLWEMLDAYNTGNTICYIANVSSGGTAVYSKDGSLLRYNTRNLGTSSNPNYYLTVWNSSAGTMVISQQGTGYWQWRPAGGGFGGALPYFGSTAYNNVHDGNLFWSLNVSMPSILGPRNALLNQTGTIRCVREGEYVIFGTQGRNDERGVVPGWMMSVSLEPGKEGTKLWEITFTPPFTSTEAGITAVAMFTGGFSLTGVYPEDDVFTFGETKQLKRWVYSLTTGELLWESDPEPQMTFYSMRQIVIDGKLVGYGSYAGTMTTYDIQTGEILWTYKARNVGSESPYGNYPMIIGAVADGKIYTYTSEHSYTSPLYRGPNLRCINATDGTELWSILDFGGGLAIADGRILSSNSMDNQIYCYGKGPSATTVTAPDTGIPLGSSVMIRGTVTDQTPTGRRNTNDKIDFTLEGTPAISDKDMAAWMEYKFMQQGYPTMARGVEVVLSVLDSNNHYYEIGKTTSDITGAFSLSWKPQIPGDFYIYAEFEGSESYGPSSASTAIVVDEAPSAAQPIEPEPTTPTPTEPTPTTPEPTTPEPTTPEPTTPEPTTPEPTEPAEAPLITTEVAIIAAIAVACVIGIVSFWALRKRK